MAAGGGGAWGLKEILCLGSGQIKVCVRVCDLVFELGMMGKREKKVADGPIL